MQKQNTEKKETAKDVLNRHIRNTNLNNWILDQRFKQKGGIL